MTSGDFPALRLHHYTSGTGLLAIFESDCLWASSIHHLNDSKEFRHAIDLALVELDKIQESTPDQNTKAICAALKDNVEQSSQWAVYVACFSTVHDSLSQWRGYCPPGFGYSLGFDGDRLRSVAQAQGFNLVECIYHPKQKNALVGGWASRTVQTLTAKITGYTNIKEVVDSTRGLYMNEILQLASRLKHDSFADEREWRLISLVPADDPRLRLRVGRSMLIPYTPIFLKFAENKWLLWDIRTGPTPHPELAMHSLSQIMVKIPPRNGICRSEVPYRSW